MPSLKNKGFTLVELAIAIMVIGLLLGGILQGQEMVENARLSRLVKQLENYKTAVDSFRSTYMAIPGDFNQASTRIPGCTYSPCNVNGNNNKWLNPYNLGSDMWPGSYYEMGGTSENAVFWHHLAQAKLITLNQSEKVDYTMMRAPIGGNVGFVASGHNAGVIGSFSEGFRGIFITLKGHYARPNADSNTGLDAPQSLRPSQALYVDQKLDNGSPYTGDVLATGEAGNCYNASGYNVSVTLTRCVVMYRVVTQ